MIQVDDLQIEAEILPLFNYTYNSDAEDAVRHLLREVPATLAQVLEKQAVLQGFLASWDVLADFSYQKIHFQEVRTFLRSVSSGRVVLETNPVKAAVKHFFSEEERYQTRARYVQAIQFLHRLQQHYVARLDTAAFPASYHPKLLRIARFMERFSLADTARAIEEDAFSVDRRVRFARQLQAVTDEEMTAFWETFCQFEAYWSVAKGMVSNDFTFPVFQKAGLVLEEFYHPLLAKPVKNTLTLQPGENVMVLTGPNMSGKSTLLKAVGLCVYLAHAGVGVPAARCQVPFFHSILLAINLRDSLRDGYSHFMAEIQNLKNVLEAAHQPGHTFAVFDELFRGTNVDDALEITRTTVQGLLAFPESCFLISTHLLHLESQLPAQASLQTYCIECQLTDGLPVFSYRLQPGWSKLKIGKLLFEKEGLNNLLGVGQDPS